MTARLTPAPRSAALGAVQIAGDAGSAGASGSAGFGRNADAAEPEAGYPLRGGRAHAGSVQRPVGHRDDRLHDDGDEVHAAVGLLTGERSGLAVLDVDPRNGGDLALEDLEESYGPLPDTPMVISGGKGPHHYFGLDGPLGKFDPGPGLNLQADGALVVAPPSLHSSGNRYEWEVSSHPDDVPLAPLPDWLRAMGEAKASAKVDGVNLPDVLPVVELHSLKLSTRMKYVLLTGNDPDDPRRYPSRSEALFAAISAMVHAGYDDATIAGVIMDKRYAISEKGWDQKNPKSPYYVEQTKAWVAGEIARARAKHAQLHVSSQARPQAASAPGQGGTVTTTVWAHAVTAQEFLQQVDTDPPAAVKDLVVPGCITVVSAPRASGKTIVALFLSVALATRPGLWSLDWFLMVC